MADVAVLPILRIEDTENAATRFHRGWTNDCVSSSSSLGRYISHLLIHMTYVSCLHIATRKPARTINELSKPEFQMFQDCT